MQSRKEEDSFPTHCFFVEECKAIIQTVGSLGSGEVVDITIIWFLDYG